MKSCQRRKSAFAVPSRGRMRRCQTRQIENRRPLRTAAMRLLFQPSCSPHPSNAAASDRPCPPAPTLNEGVELLVPLNDKIRQFVFTKGVAIQKEDGSMFPVHRKYLIGLTDLEIVSVIQCGVKRNMQLLWYGKQLLQAALLCLPYGIQLLENPRFKA